MWKKKKYKFLCYLSHHYFEFFSYMQPHLTNPSYLPHRKPIPLPSQQMAISVYQLLRPKTSESIALTRFLSYSTTIPPAILINSFFVIDPDLSVSHCFHYHSGPSHCRWPLNNIGLRGTNPLCSREICTVLYSQPTIFAVPRAWIHPTTDCVVL